MNILQVSFLLMSLHQFTSTQNISGNPQEKQTIAISASLIPNSTCSYQSLRIDEGTNQVQGQCRAVICFQNSTVSVLS